MIIWGWSFNFASHFCVYLKTLKLDKKCIFKSFLLRGCVQLVTQVFCLCLVSQLCPTLCDPIDFSPSDSSVLGDSPSSCFLGGSYGEESTCNEGDLGLIPGLGRTPGGGHGNPLQYSCLENPHGQKSLAIYSPWGHKESDTTERLSIPIYSFLDSFP